MAGLIIKRPDDLLSRKQAAEILGVKVQTLAVWESTQRYPLKCVKIGRKTVKYRRSDLQDFIIWSTEQGILYKSNPKVKKLPLPSTQALPTPTQDPPSK